MTRAQSSKRPIRSPETLYGDLPRRPWIHPGLLIHQGEILRAYAAGRIHMSSRFRNYFAPVQMAGALTRSGITAAQVGSRRDRVSATSPARAMHDAGAGQVLEWWRFLMLR